MTTSERLTPVLERILRHRAKGTHDGAASIAYDFCAGRYLDDVLVAVGVTWDEHGYYFDGKMIAAIRAAPPTSAGATEEKWEALYKTAVASVEAAHKVVDDLTGWSGSSGNWPLQEASTKLRAARAALAPASPPPPAREAETCTCGHCGKPATCYGSYEGHTYCYACDTCCGHGNEDGHCDPLSKPRTP